MLVFPSMLINAADEAGIKHPDPNIVDVKGSYKSKDYPHWVAFCKVQLCRTMEPGEHFTNAKIIANIPEADITTITLHELIELGLHYG